MTKRQEEYFQYAVKSAFDGQPQLSYGEQVINPRFVLPSNRATVRGYRSTYDHVISTLTDSMIRTAPYHAMKQLTHE